MSNKKEEIGLELIFDYFIHKQVDPLVNIVPLSLSLFNACIFIVYA